MPGDETYVHLIDVLSSSGPAWLFAAGALAIAAFVASKALPLYSKYKEEQLRLEREQIRIQGEWIGSIDRSNTVTEAITDQMKVMSAMLQESKEGNKGMAQDVRDIKQEVHDVHMLVKIGGSE